MIFQQGLLRQINSIGTPSYKQNQSRLFCLAQSHFWSCGLLLYTWLLVAYLVYGLGKLQPKHVKAGGS